MILSQALRNLNITAFQQNEGFLEQNWMSTYHIGKFIS